tara:strand:- start:13735 stop:14145 length:411 start_codon:yes stop_codon:yes gene_type:complete
MDHPWHYWLVFFVIMLIGNGIFAWRKSQGHFDGLSKARMFFAHGACVLLPMLVIGVPYGIWSFSGFHAVDARNAERMIENTFLEGGDVTSADANFILTGRSTMKGHVQLQFADGTSALSQCSAEMGMNGEYLINCE